MPVWTMRWLVRDSPRESHSSSREEPRVLQVTRDSATQISSVVEIRSGGSRRERRWNVRVTNPDGSSSVAARLLRITP